LYHLRNCSFVLVLPFCPQALSWTFYLLLQHPEIEERVLQEVRHVLGPAADSYGGSGVKPSYDQIRQLRLARACFMEALRLYPSVPQVRPSLLPAALPTMPEAALIFPPSRMLRVPLFVSLVRARHPAMTVNVVAQSSSHKLLSIVIFGTGTLWVVRYGYCLLAAR
jgi:hypothetical protein